MKRVYAKEVLLVSLMIAFVHFYYVFVLVFLLVSLFLFALVYSSEEISAFKSILLRHSPYLVPSIIYAVYYKQSLDSPTVNSVFTSTAGIGINVYTLIKNKYPIVKPWAGYLRNIYFALAIFLLIPILATIKNRRLWKLYLFSVPLILALVQFNPFLMYFVQKFNPGLDRIWRLLEVIPVSLLVSGFLYLMVEELKFLNARYITVILIAGLMALSPQIKKYNNDINYSYSTWEKAVDQQEAFRGLMQKYVPWGSVVFADPAIAWTWTTMFAHFLFIHPYSGGLPPNFDPTERMQIWKDFFVKKVDDSVINKLIAYHVDYLVLTSDTYLRKKDDLEALSKYFEKPVMIQQTGLVAIKLKK